MCGIFGLWDAEAHVAEREATARAATRRLIHRGPDDEAVHLVPDAPLALGHRRLAIQGLGPQGAQPMHAPDGAGTLVFNGELFGWQPLRERLVAEGAAFQGRSDTEVLMHALARWGVDATLERIRGQYAFAWWDARARTLTLARDRLGVRPLYYATQGGRLAFASEQKALLGLRWVDASIRDEVALRYVLLGRTDEVPFDTMLRGVSSLPAGHVARWDGRTLATRRFYRIPVAPPARTVQDVRAALERAIARQLVGEVPIGATVSGGLDSSTVVALADRVRVAAGHTQPLHLFAYHDSLAQADERPFQNAMLAAVKSPHTVHWVSASPAQLRGDFERYVHHQEEPYGDVSSYAEYCIARTAREHGVKVLLGGLGGDEVFVGYPAYLGALANDLFEARRFDVLRDIAAGLGAVFAGDAPAHPGRYVATTGAYYRLPTPLRAAITAARTARATRLPVPLGCAAMIDAAQHWHAMDGRPRVNAALRSSLESWSVPRYLLHSDRMGLAHGVEGRVPLLDEEVVETAFGVPPAERVDRTGLKATLRHAVADALPRVVAERAWKMGFHAPLKAYVAALDEPLRAGWEQCAAVFDRRPRWEALPHASRWIWGNLGAYAAWVATQRA